MQLIKSSELSAREDFGALLNKRYTDRGAPHVRSAVEIGVHCAAFSIPFLSKWGGRMLYAVDPWITNLDGYADVINNPGRDRSADMMLALCALARFNGRVTPLRCTSRVAAGFIPNGLEFVYIDGNHAKEYQYDDMTVYWPKLRSNGILAGHDLDGDWKPETMWALEKFTQEAGIVQVFYVQGEAASWYCYKP